MIEDGCLLAKLQAKIRGISIGLPDCYGFLQVRLINKWKDYDPVEFSNDI